MKKGIWFLKVLFAAYALAFAVVLSVFLGALFIFGPDRAGMIWTGPVMFAGWLISIPICMKFLSK